MQKITVFVPDFWSRVFIREFFGPQFLVEKIEKALTVLDCYAVTIAKNGKEESDEQS